MVSQWTGPNATCLLACARPGFFLIRFTRIPKTWGTKLLKDIPALPTSQVYQKIQNASKKSKNWENCRFLPSIYASCFSHFIFTSVKISTNGSSYRRLMKLLIWLTFLQNAAVFKVFKNNETVDCRQTFLNCFWNSDLHWKQFFRSSSNLNQTLSIIIQQF